MEKFDNIMTSQIKSSGPHLKDIPNLTGTPGNKTTLSGIVFCIEADKIGKNTPYAFITPLQVVGNDIITVSKANAEIVKFGSGNGYTDCKLWFTDQNLAANALAYCQNKFGSKFTNYVLGKANADKNGYFQVTTALGIAYIKAGRLNEELDEALTNKPLPKLGTLDIEAFYKERD